MDLMLIRLPYIIVYFLSISVSVAVFFYAWRNRTARGVKAFMWSIFFEIIWLLGYMLELNAQTLNEKLFWDNFQHIGAFFAPVALLVFSLQFTGRKFNLRRLVILTSIIPVFAQIIIFANIWPQLTRPNIGISPGLPFDELIYDFGAITAIGNGYLYLLSLAYVIILFSAYRRRDTNTAQVKIIAIGTALPIMGIIIFLALGIKFGNQRDTSPLMFTLSNIIIAWGIFRYRLFNIIPVAREILFENMNNALIILDENDRILDTNSAARSILGNRSRENLNGMHISILQPDLYQKFGHAVEMQTEIKNKEGRVFDFRITPLYNQRNVLIGRLINANDITIQKKTEEVLKVTNEQNQQRALQLEAIANVSQTISRIQDMDQLLPLICQQISQNFDFYHVSVFLNNPEGTFAELVAANSEGGKRMLQRDHRLEIGRVGVVGRVAKDGQPRVALDVGQDAAYFDNPDLPDTHSEMALPLKIGDHIIGVLDVQSKRKGIFSQEDAKIFASLSNQVAIAIENSRQAEATQLALEEARALSQEQVREAWARLVANQRQKGYRYTGKAVVPLTNMERTALQSDEHILEIPVELRYEKIGVLKVKTTNDAVKNLSSEDRELIQAIANRAALALENARLLEDTSRRAQRERLVSEITTKMRSTNEPEEILKTAMQELKKVLDASRIELEETTPEEVQGK